MRVLKWDVPVDDKPHTIGGGPVLHVACQHDAESVQVWTEEEGMTGGGTRQVQVYGTGQPMDPWLHHKGTALAPNGLVWHVFELPRAIEEPTS